MATKSKTTEKAIEKPTTKTTAIANWDDELARQAAIYAKVEESTQTGSFFNTRGGILTFNDAALPNNTMAVIILDAVLENTFYEGAYNPDAPSPPVCFAFGRDESEIAPHRITIEASNQQCGASGLCQGCEKNEWGTADTGRGKACKNTRRLALIPCGTFDKAGDFTAFEDPAHFETAGIGLLKLPVTSVKGYAGYVKQWAAFKRPPFALFTRVRLAPDASTQFKITFEALGEVPRELLPAIMPRVEEARAAIEVPYAVYDPEAIAAAAATRAPPRRGAKAIAPTRGKKF